MTKQELMKLAQSLKSDEEIFVRYYTADDVYMRLEQLGGLGGMVQIDKINEALHAWQEDFCLGNLHSCGAMLNEFYDMVDKLVKTASIGKTHFPPLPTDFEQKGAQIPEERRFLRNRLRHAR